MNTEEIPIHRPAALIQAETFIGYVLRYGVILCGLVIGTGIVLSFLRPQSTSRLSGAINEVLSGKSVATDIVPRSYAAFRQGIEQGDSSAIIALGLLMLISLPVFRVAFTVVLFLIERDWIYLAITLFVLAVLLSGLIFGKSL